MTAGVAAMLCDGLGTTAAQFLNTLQLCNALTVAVLVHVVAHNEATSMAFGLLCKRSRAVDLLVVALHMTMTGMRAWYANKADMLRVPDPVAEAVL